MAFQTTKNKVVLVAVESTYGTAPTMNAATAVKAMNATVRVIGEQLKQTLDKPWFGGDPFVLVGKRIELDFEVDLLGAATPGDASPLGPVYRGCGYSQTLDAGVDAVYAPVSTGQASVTIDFYWAGILFRMTGGRGAMDLEFATKKYGVGKCKFVGILTTPADGTIPVGIDLSAFQTPAAIETATWALSVGAQAVDAISLMISQNGTMPLIETSESRQVVWTDRAPSGELIVVKNLALSTWNPWGIANAHTIVDISNVVTGGAGLNVSCPVRAQLGFPEPTEVEGVAAFKIPLSFIPSEDGNDHTLTFT